MEEVGFGSIYPSLGNSNLGDLLKLNNPKSRSALGLEAGEMAADLQFPFTSSQWKELERQATIYKYMMASIPVPTHLLFPIPTNFPAEITSSTTRGVDLYGWRYSSSAVAVAAALSNSNKDAEPGRCKRTDGKKWRCSRDVAPNQKYCERHMHRGRPRSRKHVEVQPLVSPNNTITTNKKTRLNSSNFKDGNSQQMFEITVQSKETSHISAKREVNLKMEDKMMGIEVVGQQWQNFMNPKIENHPSLFQKQYEGEGMNLFSYTDSTTVRDVNFTSEESHFFLNSEKETKGGFIDAWSNDSLIRTTNNVSSVSSPRGHLSPSSLTLSMAMAAANVTDGKMEKIQEGGCNYKNKETNFLSNYSWVPFASDGGPLAEVLHTGGATNPASPYAGKGEQVSPVSTNISSPSGVQHRSLFN